jgi:hypothetical protein
MKCHPSLRKGTRGEAHDGFRHTILQGDVNGDGAADLEVRLDGAPVPVADDFIF